MTQSGYRVVFCSNEDCNTQWQQHFDIPFQKIEIRKYVRIVCLWHTISESFLGNGSAGLKSSFKLSYILYRLRTVIHTVALATCRNYNHFINYNYPLSHFKPLQLAALELKEIFFSHLTSVHKRLLVKASLDSNIVRNKLIKILSAKRQDRSFCKRWSKNSSSARNVKLKFGFHFCTQ